MKYLYYGIYLIGFLIFQMDTFAQAGQISRNWTDFSQSIDISSYKGKRFRLHAAVKVEGKAIEKCRAQLWLSIENETQDRLFYDDMYDRPIMPAPNWASYTIEGSIDPKAQKLTFGAKVYENGSFSFDAFQFQIEEAPDKWVNIPIANWDFEGTWNIKKPEGWNINSDKVKEFKASLLEKGAFQGKFSLQIIGDNVPPSVKKGSQGSHWVSFGQRIDIGPYVGKRFRLSAKVKVLQNRDSRAVARLYARVDKLNGETGFFENMYDRPIKSSQWNVYKITGTIDEKGKSLSVGGMVFFNGSFLFDEFILEIETQKGDWQTIYLNNGGFESGLEMKNRPIGWKGKLGEEPNFKVSLSSKDKFAGEQALLINGHVEDPFTPMKKYNEQSLISIKIENDLAPTWDYLYPSNSIDKKNQVFEVFQDDLGFIWVATNGGLAKYDGTKFKFFDYDSNQNGAPCNIVYYIHSIEPHNLWLGTECGLVIFDLKTESFYLDSTLTSFISNGEVSNIVKDDEREIWISIRGGGTFRYHRNTGIIQPFSIYVGWKNQPTLSKSLDRINYLGNGKFLINDNFRHLPIMYDKYQNSIGLMPYPFSKMANPISFIARDERGDVWYSTMNTGKGLGKIDFQSGLLTHYKETGFLQGHFGEMGDNNLTSNIPEYFDVQANLSSNYVNDVLHSREGRIMVSTDKGINIYIPDKNGFAQVAHQSNHPQSSHGDKIYSLYEDREGNIWASTEAGIRILWKYKNSFHYHEISIPKEFYGNRPASIKGVQKHYDDKLLLWNKTDIYLFDPYSNQTLNLRTESLLFDFLKNKPVHFLHTANDGTIWIGTDYVPNIPGNYSLYHYDLKDRRLLGHYHYGTYGNDKLTLYATTALAEKDSKEIWIGTYGGLNMLDLQTNNIKKYLHDPNDQYSISSNNITCLFFDYKGELWIGTSNGLNKYVWAEDRFIRYRFDANDSLSISNNEIFDIEEDSQQRLWISTKNGLNLFNAETNSFKTFINEPVSSLDKTFFDIIKDDLGYFWVVRNEGLSKFDPREGVFTHFNQEDGLMSNILSKGFKDREGKIYIGGKTGVAYFNPAEINLNNPNPPKIVLSDFLLADKSVAPGVKGSVLDEHIAYTQSITLRHWQDNFTIKYAALAYTNPSQNQYAYKLEGFDEEWQHVGNKTEATYTNLSPTTYTFRVKGSNGDGVWNEEGASLKITILPPWWWSLVAKLIYLFLLLGGVYALYRFQLNRQLHMAEAKRLKELDEVKNRLYGNITHEFRTPLTVILGMANKIGEKPEKWLENGLIMIKRNSSHLLRLVNQMLDLTRLESGRLSLNTIQSDVVPYIYYLTESFQSYAESKEIELHILPHLESLVMDYDPDRLMDVISNLITNAIKFTPTGGNVYLSISTNGLGESINQSVLILRIKDTGIGISEEKMPYIFDRFYQADDSTTRRGEGTGIGLALTQELIKLMGGTIHAKSVLGKGSEFVVKLPIKHYAPITEHLFTEGQFAKSYSAGERNITPLLPTLKIEHLDLPRILIIEDNSDVISYLISCLEADYQIEVASNGQEGIDKALEIVPDLVISDIMMPEKDGFEVCDTLKRDVRSSHIPIILLTARADMASKIEGLQMGADAYLAKPFNEEELQVRIGKLLELRQELQEKYGSIDYLSATQKQIEKLPDLEDIFLVELRETIMNHLTDYELDVPKLCKLVGMSRSQLHRKLTALTSKSATKFIREVRLTKAKDLILSTDLPISAIGYDTGFNNPNYFTRAFSDLYGMSPSQYREEKKEV